MTFFIMQTTLNLIEQVLTMDERIISALADLISRQEGVTTWLERLSETSS